MAHREVVITRVAPMSAFRVGLALSLVGLVAWVICVAVLYFGLDSFGVWDNVNSVIGGVGGEQKVTFGLVMSVSALVGAIMAIAATIMAPVGALIYNAVVDLFGGLRVRLSETRSIDV